MTVSKLYNKFSRDLLKGFYAENRYKNVVFSPLSVLLLGIAAQAASGTTRDEIVKAFSSDMTYDDVMVIITDLLKTLPTKRFSIANAVLIRNDYESAVKEEYKQNVKDVFNGDVFSSANLIREVNAWIKKKTNGMIDKILDESASEMAVCLINAVSFEDKWLKPYEPDDIDISTFNNADGSISEVKVLYSNQIMLVKNDRLIGTIRPYKISGYAFMPLLPTDEDDPNGLEKALEDIDLTELFKSTEEGKTVYLTLPEYKYDFGAELIKTCKKMGITEAFTPNADFSEMSAAPLMLDSIIHKAHIEVDRSGTRAAAATEANFIAGSSLNFEKIYRINLDRPFIYAIVHVETGLPVFVGIVNRIESSAE